VQWLLNRFCRVELVASPRNDVQVVGARPDTAARRAALTFWIRIRQRLAASPATARRLELRRLDDFVMVRILAVVATAGEADIGQHCADLRHSLADGGTDITSLSPQPGA
jgi:hypothetical protein